MDKKIRATVNSWLSGSYDAATKATIRALMAENETEIIDSFYKGLAFGTGGLRGIMGVGPNRMNKYTVGTATQGLANYLKQVFTDKVRVAIAYDSRHNSDYFSKVIADIFAANGFKVFLFESLRPTPILSYAIRYLKCHSGVVVTASHNPKEYNGYKVYWQDGGQVVAPHDAAIMAEVTKIDNVAQVKFDGLASTIHTIGKEIDEAYLNTIHGLSIAPEAISAQHDLKIVYTPIHGTGITLVPAALKKFGFTNVSIVDSQAIPDGDFPTVTYPNPEEAAVLSQGLQQAKALDADILLGTDPDADRVGIAVKNHKGTFQLLNGNQTAVLLFNYLISRRKEKGLARKNDYICKTIVTTELIDVFAKAHNIPCFNVLTGFKYIAQIIREKEGKMNYVVGGEESYGYMIGSDVRDKDAVASVALLCEMVAYAKNEGLSVFDMLIDIYLTYGYYKEHLIAITKKGKKGAEEIEQMMKNFRAKPPESINGSRSIEVRDYKTSVVKHMLTGKESVIDLPASNVLQFYTADGSKISIRPSGTEPKIKCYFSVNTTLATRAAFDETTAFLDQRIQNIIKDINLV